MTTERRKPDEVGYLLSKFGANPGSSSTPAASASTPVPDVPDPVSRVGELLAKFQAYPTAQSSVPQAPGMPESTANPRLSADEERLRRVEATMRFGSDADRAALITAPSSDAVNRIADLYSMSAPEIDRRVSELQAEIPNIPKVAGEHASLWGRARNIAGDVIGIALDGLDLPASGVERLIGMAYYNDVPSLRDRWHLAATTYDTIWADVFSAGNGGKQQAVHDYFLGDSLDDIEERYANGWADGIGHIALDPLWLVGGVPLVTKLLPEAARGTRAARLIDKGLDFSKIPGLRNVPILGRAGQPIEARILERTFAEVGDGVTTSAIYPDVVNTGLRRLHKLNPSGRVDEHLGDMGSIALQFTDPRLVGDGSMKAGMAGDMTILRDTIDALHTGQPLRGGVLGPMFETSLPVRRTRGVFEQGRGAIQGRWQDYQSLRSVALKNDFWADAEHVLKATDAAGNPTNLIDLARQGVQLTPEQAQRVASYRMTKFMDEFLTKGVGTLNDYYGVQTADWIAKADSFSAAMKSVLSLTVINNPRFVFLNYLNNAFHLTFKAGDLGATARYLRKGLHADRFAASEMRLLDDLGFGDGLIRTVAADANFRAEFLPNLQNAKGAWWRQGEKLAFFVNQADRLDQGMRMRSTLLGAKRGAMAAWDVVKPTAPAELTALVPDAENLIDGMKLGSFADIQKLEDTVKAAVAAAPPTVAGGVPANVTVPTGQLVSGNSLLSGWARNTWRANNPNIAQTPVNNATLLMHDVPGAVVEQIDEMVDAARGAMANGSPTWVEDLYSSLDDLADGIDLDVWRAMVSDGRMPPSLPMDQLRPDRLVPWQDVAHFERSQQIRNELATRILARHAHEFASPSAARAAVRRLSALNEEYTSYVSRRLEQLMSDGAKLDDHRRLITLKEDMLAFIDRRQSTEAGNAFARFFRNHESMAGDMLDFWTMEREQVARAMDERIAAALGGVDEYQDAIRRMHVADNAFHEEAANVLKLDFRRQYSIPEYPTFAGASVAHGGAAQSFVRHARQNAVQQLRSVTTVPVPTPQATTNLTGFFDELRQAMRQRNVVASINGRATRDFTSLNYSRKYGIDSLLNVIMPYSFWPTRTLRDWARLTQARPGQTAALTAFYSAIADINGDANLPDRLKQNIRIPLPFGGELIDTILGGEGNGAIYFDPIKVLYPLASWQDNNDFPTSDNLTTAGQAVDFVSNLGIGLNPFATLGLGATGGLGERDDWVRRGLSSVSSLPYGVPGPRTLRAATDWLAGVVAEPDEALVPERVQSALINGEAVDKATLSSWLGHVWDLASTDGFEGYRTDRMVSNLVGMDPQRYTPRMGLEALRTKSGPLYERAKAEAAKEYGMRVLTGWALMPLRAYPEGEQVQRGLDSIFRQVQDQGSEAVSEFYDQHPEYRIRQLIAVDREDGSMAREIDTSLFYIDSSEVRARYAPHIEELRDVIAQAETRGYLESKEGRRMIEVIRADLNYLVQQQEDEIGNIEALYPNRSTELSEKASPRERALYSLREQFFNIRRSDYATSEAFFDAREAFIARLPAQGNTAGAWVGSAVSAAATYQAYSDRIAAAESPEARRALLADRKTRLDALAAEAQGQIGREDFQSYLNASARPKTPERVEYETASAQITEYFAIPEAPGLSTNAAKQLQREYWASHPLLDTYYGGEPRAWDAESAATYGRLDQIWSGFHDRSDDPQAQRDYLAANLDELNMLRDRVFLEPISLVDWSPVTAGMLQQSPSSPAERALQESIRPQ